MAPTTPFEDRIAAEEFPDWTSIAEEAQYLSDLAAHTSRFVYEQVGTSAEGNPLWLCRVGHPTAPTKVQAAAGPVVMIVAQQHGPEVAGREAVLQLMRDLALATGAIATYLEAVTWVFLPTCNPDRVGSSRNNANNVNLNRDHVDLSQPPTQAIHEAIRDYQPRVLIDAHEALNSSADLEYSGSNHPGAHADITSVTATLINNYVIPAMTANSWTTDKYWHDAQEDRLSNIAALRHVVALLIETERTTTPNEISRELRTSIQYRTLEAVRDFDDAESTAIESAVAASIAEKTQNGIDADVPFDLRTTSLNPPPIGYLLTTQQRTDTALHRDLFDIVIGEDDVIDMGQAAQPVIPFVFDAAAEFSQVSGERLFAPESGPLYITFTSYQPGDYSATSTIAKPSGTADGDMLLAIIEGRQFDGQPTVTPPSGWTQLQFTHTGAGADHTTSMVYFKIAGGSEPADYTWTTSQPLRRSGGILRITGHDGEAPLIGTAQVDPTDVTNITAQSIDAVDNTLLIYVGAGTNNGGATTSISLPSGMTEQWNRQNFSSSTVNHRQLVASQAVDAGATGTRVSTHTFDYWASALLAINPAGGTTPVIEATAIEEPGTFSRPFTIPKPTGTVAGDLLVGIISGRLFESVPPTGITLPSGWTLRRHIQSGRVTAGVTGSGDQTGDLWWAYKIAGESEPADYTWDTLEGINLRWVGGILRISGADQTTPILDDSANSSGDAYAPSVAFTTGGLSFYLSAGTPAGVGERPRGYETIWSLINRASVGSAVSIAEHLSVRSTGGSAPASAPHGASAGRWIATQITVAPEAGSETLTIADLSIALGLAVPALTQAGTLAVNDAAIATTLDSPTLSAAIDLTVADLLASVSLDSPALTQAHTLSVNDADVAVTLETPALTQAHALAVADTDIGITLDSPTLTAAGSLSIADLLLAVAIDQPLLTQAHQLSIADLAMGVTLDGVTLTTGLTLTIDGVDIALSLDNVQLTQAGVLIVQGLDIPLSVDAVTLTQAHALTVADLLSAVGLDSPELTTAGNVLSIQDAQIAVTLDSPALTQSHILAVNDAVIAVTLGGITIVIPGAEIERYPRITLSRINRVTLDRINHITLSR